MIQHFFETKRLAALVIVVSIVALAFAYISEYAFGLRPCQLCVYQRLPYAVAILFGLLSFYFGRPMLLLAGLAFLANAALAGFHAGVEYGWWEGLSSCGGALGDGASIEDLKKMLEGQDIVRCDKPAWMLFGVSMAGYNYLLSFALFLIVTLALKGKSWPQSEK